MSLTHESGLEHDVGPIAIGDAIAFEAPYVIERLLRDRVADTPAEAEQLFDAAKKYLILCELNRDVVVGMYSARVDEAWHAFILYTAQYSEFSERFFGKYLQHAPSNAPTLNGGCECANAELTFDEFRAKYEDCFHEPLPDVWYNERSVSLTRRMFNDSAGAMTVVRGDSVAELLDESGDTILSVNALALESLDFIARTGAFYVRELPGDLTDDERVSLVQALSRCRVLRIAP